MIISLSGKPGSGKSTVAKKIAQDFGLERIYIGGLRREAARARGMTLAEFNKLGESSDETDKIFDEEVGKIGATRDKIVIESRTAFHFIPHSVKIFLDVTPEEGAKRIWKALRDKKQSNRNEGRDLSTYEDVLASVRERIDSDYLRYKKYYGIDIFNRDNYDLFLDTTNLTPEEEYQVVHGYIKNM
ncbi:MAG: AAA family ATPase [Patescibacteria group bacterium]|jgi:cytidylate kinase